jgi:Recombination endonuclease VII
MRDVPFSEMRELPEYTWCDFMNDLSKETEPRRAAQFKTNYSLPSKHKGTGRVNFSYEDVTKLKAATKVCMLCSEQFKDSKDKHGDHNHETGNLRGILCGACNKMLGWYEKFKKDNELVRQFERYLGGSK